MATAVKYLDPVTSNIHYKDTEQAPKTLLQCSVCFIRKIIGIDRLLQATTLEVPQSLQQDIMSLSLSDFHINPDDLTSHHQENRTFPATCLTDGNRVTLRLHDSNETVSTDSTLLAVFPVNNQLKCSVFVLEVTLAERIADAKSNNEIILENLIWQSILYLSRLLPTKQPNQVHINPSSINIKRGSLSINERASQPEQNALSFMAFYEAPEILMRQPVTDKSLSWTIGCLVYEMMALDAAFYDRENSGNPMAVMMQMTQGKKPPPLPRHYSAALIDTVEQCFSQNPNDRPSTQDLQIRAKTRLNIPQ